MTPRLPARLRTVLEMVPATATRIADVGAGHGALAAHLALRSARVIAVESQPGPLRELRANLQAWQLSERVDTRSGDGLACLDEREVELAVVAGLGAQHTLGIVEAAASKRIRWLVLQCMQRAELIEPWLAERCWKVVQRRDVRDGRRAYPTWLVEVPL